MFGDWSKVLSQGWRKIFDGNRMGLYNPAGDSESGLNEREEGHRIHTDSSQKIWQRKRKPLDTGVFAF